MTDIERSALRTNTKVYLVGGGIASLAAAAFLIRDGDLLGRNITLFEQLDILGGSLDGPGSPDAGYVLRGGRMFESKYLCTFDLFASIPTLDKRQTVTQEIFAWNETMKTSSKSRLVRGGKRIVAPELGLSEKDILNIERLVITPEALLGVSSIEEQFDPSFFKTNFWFMWCTTFAFQPWHSAVEFKRYLVRFTHMVPGFNRLRGIMRTLYNQYDSLVRPLQAWLEERGVQFERGTRVTGLAIGGKPGAQRVDAIDIEQAGKPARIVLGANDHAIVTLGSMTDASSLGSMDTAATLKGKKDGASFLLWEKIAAGRPEFGNPLTFAGHVDQSKWLSFTTTLRDPEFFNLVRDFTGNVPGEGGLVTFAESSWLASIVLPHQPHFIGQPESVQVFWGYGLNVDKPGDFVKKPMAACNGRELMTEILGHLGALDRAPKILEAATCVPCMMPFITSQFLKRAQGDRPAVVPKGYSNLAFTGQYVELPDDVVFTVEYSIRSAQVAAYAVLGLDLKPPAVYQGKFDPRVLVKAFAGLHDLAS